MNKTKLQNFRATEEQISQIKNRAEAEGLTATEFILKRISADPILIEELNKIKEMIKKGAKCQAKINSF